MPVPYTREAVARLREAARNSMPPESIIAQFGWSPGMLQRVCRDHGIDIAPTVVASSVTHTRVDPLTPAEKLMQFISHLSSGQTHVMTVLRAASLIDDAYISASGISGFEPRHTRTRAVGRMIQILNAKLEAERLPYRIDVRVSEGYAYRLKFTVAKT